MAAARGAVVSGLDASPALIAIAKARLPVADFRVGDLEALPFADGAFHSVIAANSVQYAADPVTALKELARVCAPRGRVAIGVWASPEQVEMRHVFAAVRAALLSPPPGEGPFALSMPGRLEQLTTQAGFRAISSGEVDCPFEYANVDALWRAQRSAGPLQGAMRAAGEAKIEEAVRGAVRRFVKPDGRVRLENRFRYVVLSK
jgi:SAM-dependent methyltransferase